MLQSVCGTATLDDLKFANKLLQEANESSDDGLFFKSGLFHQEQNGDAPYHRCQLRKRVELPQSKRADDFSHWT